MKLYHLFQAAAISAVALLPSALIGAEEVIDLTPKTLAEIKFDPTDEKGKDFLKRKEIPKIDDFKINKKAKVLPKKSDLEAILHPEKSFSQPDYVVFAKEPEKRKMEGHLLLQKYQPNIATVLCIDKESFGSRAVGSGFFLSPNLFITVDHVTQRSKDDGDQIYVLAYNSSKIGQLVKATVLGSTKDREFSFCISEYPFRDVQPIEIAKERPSQGDTLFALYQEFHTTNELGRNLTNPNEKIRTIPLNGLQLLIKRTYLGGNQIDRELALPSDVSPSYVLCIGNSGFMAGPERGIKTNALDPLMKKVEPDVGPSKKYIYTGYLKGEGGNSGTPVIKDKKLAGLLAIAGTDTNHCFIVPPETIIYGLEEYARKLPELEEKIRKESK